MADARIVAMTIVTMIAFASNSLLCRIALKLSAIDPASFTTIRLFSGAVVLLAIARGLRSRQAGKGNWMSATALFAYAAGFSFAYVSLPAATGALLLFGAVQTTMIGHGMWKGERLRGWRLIGVVLAFAGLLGLLLPGIAAPPLLGGVLMLGAGVAWGVYSLRGRGAGDPTKVTAGNFLRATFFAVLLSLWLNHGTLIDATASREGILFAIMSGALSSGIGYAIWYSVLPALKSTNAATVQLSVPVIAALGGIVFLGEAVTLRLILASIAILGGIGLVILAKQDSSASR